MEISFYVGAFLLFLQFVHSPSFGSGFEFLRVSPCIFSLFESIFRYFPGFLGYCKTTLGSEETLNADCFLRTRLIEGYVEFLRVSFRRYFFLKVSWLRACSRRPRDQPDQRLSTSRRALVTSTRNAASIKTKRRHLDFSLVLIHVESLRWQKPLLKLEKQKGQFSSIVFVPVGILIRFLWAFSQLLMVHATAPFHFHFDFLFSVWQEFNWLCWHL